mgnify:CR=1 FL=1
MNRINCLVEECIYNKNKDCEASKIEVWSNDPVNVSQPDHTFCKTFSLK